MKALKEGLHKTFWDATKKSENKNEVNFCFDTAFWNARGGMVQTLIYSCQVL